MQLVIRTRELNSAVPDNHKDRLFGLVHPGVPTHIAEAPDLVTKFPHHVSEWRTYAHFATFMAREHNEEILVMLFTGATPLPRPYGGVGPLFETEAAEFFIRAIAEDRSPRTAWPFKPLRRTKYIGGRLDLVISREGTSNVWRSKSQITLPNAPETRCELMNPQHWLTVRYALGHPLTIVRNIATFP